MLALIDMDIVCYRCAASAENDDVGIAIYRQNELLDQILEMTGATEYKAFLSGKKNFRKQIYPEYKANRKQPKPIHLDECRDYAMQEQSAELAPINLEADDALGINQGKDTIICSLDKDLLQIPGHHYSWEISGKGWKKPHTFREISELEGLRLFYEQCLKGDRTDNIRGIEKIGDKKAKVLLEPCTTEQQMFNKVREMYGNDEEFLMNANCLWILRNERETFTERFAQLQE